MSSFKGFRKGKKLPKKDIQNRINAYNRKIEEYDKLSLEELKTLYPTLRGVYREACINVTNMKLDKARELLTQDVEKSKESINDLDLNTIDEAEEEPDNMKTSVAGAIEGE